MFIDYSSVPANPPGEASYTIPTVQFPDGTYIMDSIKIATKIEKDHPEPPLHLDSPILPEVIKIGNKIMAPIKGITTAGVYTNLLPETSKEYFGRTREKRFGKPILQFAKENGGEEAWLEALPGIKELADLLKANGGPFVMGKTRELSYCFGGLSDIASILRGLCNRRMSSIFESDRREFVSALGQC